MCQFLQLRQLILTLFLDPYLPGFRIKSGLSCVNGLFGRQGLATTLEKQSSHETRHRSANVVLGCPLKELSEWAAGSGTVTAGRTYPLLPSMEKERAGGEMPRESQMRAAPTFFP